MDSASGGKIIWVLDVDSKQFDSKLNKSSSNAKDFGKGNEKVSADSNKAFNTIAKVGLAAVAAAAITVGALITKNIGGAIKRIDTINNSQRVFQNLGFSADDVAVSMDNLIGSITGLPTKLDDAVLGVQALSASTKDIGKGQELFSALNNAVLGLGKGAGEVDSAVLAMSRAIDKGKLQGQEWMMLMNAGLGPALTNIAQEMGITTGALQEGLSDGSISVEDFTNRLLKANEDGVGSMASFEQMAKDSTSGIGTSWSNLNTSIERGIAGIIESVGSENISEFVTSLGSSLETTLKNAGNFFEFIIRNQNVFIPLSLSIGTMIGLITAWWTITKLMTIAQAILNVTMMANPIGAVIVLILGLVAGFLWLWHNVEGFRNFFITAWDMIMGAVTGVFNWVKDNWPLLLAIITGPIGLAILAIIRNFDKIKTVIRKVWTWITGIFSTIGAIGTSIIKGVVNGVIGFAERTVNGFIGLINLALGAINKIPGVSIGTISTLSIPRLAEGGVVMNTPGGILANIGEGSEPEAVIPLSKLQNMMQGGSGGQGVTINLNMSGVMTRSPSDMREITKEMIRSVNQELKARQLEPIGGGAI